MSSTLSAAAIAAHSRAGVAIEVVASTGSTNADLMARVPTLTAPLLLVAIEQTAGKGRAGRSWLSDSAGSLTFSLAWRFARPLPRLAGLPLAVGVALAETLGQLGVQVQLKWPNDLLKDGNKLAGVLIESRSSADGALWGVIGVGLNLALPDHLEQQIARPAANATWLAQMDRNALMAALLDGLANAVREFEERGFLAFIDRWNARHAYAGADVQILDHGAVLQSGTAAGVDEQGNLLLDTASGRAAVVAGDVSLRPKA
ncbi:biotin--[acetyl-CoA-carboxylase] ligase [Massilia sp. TS11]|uniref:biotin--[acetyl-CoA-carboxylase] ligase n=1 Tax=Massilia sp. TS11 TaxID=2908003 RepID=UPI001EDBBC95|nr:biotin--[acetyl-CoA-carboxylase] ligase [Massilia sp. TS11]MCG2585478.1 biotin--[acetyl-CoA-carboxylase] ligase [Massilia sp. TS11]